MDIHTVPEGMSEEEYNKRLRYQQLDEKVFQTFIHNEDAYDLYKDCMKFEYQYPIKNRIQELEVEVLKRDLQIATLKKENDLIWKNSIEKIAEEKMQVREARQRLETLLGEK